MAVISTRSDHKGSWVVSGHAVREVLGRALPRLEHAEDISEMEVAIIRGALILDLLDAAQAGRLARAVESAAGDIERELRAKADSTYADLWFANSLAELQSYLHEVPD